MWMKLKRMLFVEVLLKLKSIKTHSVTYVIIIVIEKEIPWANSLREITGYMDSGKPQKDWQSAGGLCAVEWWVTGLHIYASASLMTLHRPLILLPVHPALRPSGCIWWRERRQLLEQRIFIALGLSSFEPCSKITKVLLQNISNVVHLVGRRDNLWLKVSWKLVPGEGWWESCWELRVGFYPEGGKAVQKKEH